MSGTNTPGGCNLVAPSVDEDAESAVVTAYDILAMEELNTRAASKTLGRSINVCSYARGYISQPVYVCITCRGSDPNNCSPLAGICYACHVSCHADHVVKELWAKRNFRCDCPTSRMPHCRCHIYPESYPTVSKLPPNQLNKYNQNFIGSYCSCKIMYDPEITDQPDMVQCLECQDWFHENCTIIPVTHSKESSCLLGFEKEKDQEIDNDDDNHDDEIDVDMKSLSPASISSSRFGSPSFLCPNCISKCPHAAALAYYALKQTAVQNSFGTNEIWCIHNAIAIHTVITENIIPPPPPPEPEPQPSAVFLPQGWREKLCDCFNCAEIYKVAPHVKVEEKVYLPERDPEASISLHDAGLAALSQLDSMRVQYGANQFAHVGEVVREKLRVFKETGRVVTENDIKEIFSGIRSRFSRPY